MRRTNLELFKNWVRQNGELAKEDLASKSRIPFYTIDRILQGKTMPSELQQIALCSAMAIERNDLFPVCETEKESA